MRIWPAILSIESPVSRNRTTSSRLKIRRGRPIAFPVFVPCALAARIPALTRSRINSRSNCADCGEPQYADYVERAIMQSQRVQVTL
jgi:hypothetical protein